MIKKKLLKYLKGPFFSKKEIHVKQEIINRYLYMSSIDDPIYVEKNNVQEKWSIEKFENEMEVKYLSNLFFEEKKDLIWMIKKCDHALHDGFIDEKQRWLGIFIENEIRNGKIAPTYIKWIDPIMEWGIFARENINAGVFVAEYTGCIKKYKRAIDDHNAYCFEYSIGGVKKTPFTIDAKEKGNLSRFINHSFSPNLLQVPAYLDGIMHVVFRSSRNIKKGEQLTYNYGSQYWKKRENPL